MKFFRDVVSHLIKNAFEAHAQFSVADDKAVGDDVVRSVTLDAVPLSETNTIISLAWEGGVKLFEKTLPEQEASHQFELISTDLSEVAALTKQGQYDSAKELMTKLGQKYAENTGEIVDTNVPKLHVTQAAHKHSKGTGNAPCDKCGKEMCPECGWADDDGKIYHNRCKKSAALIKKFAFDTDEIEEELREAILDAASQMNGVPQTKAYAIARDLFDYFPRNSDVIKYIENFIGNEFDLRHYVEDILLEAEEGDIVSSNDPDANLWKQAKVTLKNVFPSGTVQEMTFDTAEEAAAYQGKGKGGKNTPLWEQNKGNGKPAADTALAPASLSYEDAEAEAERDHEDIQKQIDEKIKTELESALQEKAASVFGPDQIELIKILKKNGRNWDEIKKILVKDFGFDKDSTNIFVDEQRQALDPAGIEVEPVQEDKKEAPLTPPENLVSPETHDKLLQDHEDKKKDKTPLKEPSFTPQDVMNISEEAEIQNYSSEIARADNSDIHKIAAPDTNPLQEPLKEAPTTPAQDAIPFGKNKDHNAPQHGDRVFVGSDLADEKSGFEATFISTYQSQGREYSIVQTDGGDMLEVESHRVAKTMPNSGPQETEPAAEPQIEQPKDDEIPVTPKQTDLTTSALDEAIKIKAELAELTKILIEADDEQLTMWDERSYDEKYPMMAKYPDMVDPVIAAIKKFPDSPFRLDQELFDHVPGYMWISSAAKSREGWDLVSEVKQWMQENEQGGDKVWVPRKYEPTEASAKSAELPAEHVCEQCKQPMGYQGFLSPICEKCVRQNHKKVTGSETMASKCGCGHLWKDHTDENECSFEDCDCKKFHKTASDFEKGISQNKDAADPVPGAKTHFKNLQRAPAYTPSGDAIPANAELAPLLDKMDAIQQNLATLKAAREEIAAKLNAELQKVDEAGGRAQMEAELQELIEKTGVLIDAVDSKVVQHKEKLYTLQTQETHYVEKLTPSDIVKRLYKKYADAEQYITDVKNGMLAQAQKVMEKTLYQWPKKKSSSMETQADPNPLDELNHYNEELMAALNILSAE